MQVRGVSQAAIRWSAVIALLLSLVLIPFWLAGSAMDEWALRTIGSLETNGLVAGLIVALLALDILLPIPSSLTSIAGGAFLGWPMGALASFVGLTLGCCLGYAIGAKGGRAGLVRLVGESEVARFEGIAAKHGVWALAISRAVPVLAEASVLLAGAAAVPMGRFLMITSLSNLGIAFVYSVAGAAANHATAFLFAFVVAVCLPVLPHFVATRSSRR